ncbi:Sperm motility kinase X [Microtus ochrogaster]|uniref:non-specific serine/threonine protein kinase n=1 Tax=Microtus ochrogaster TaxID=79684 RepID=A0A8J6FYU6_MICOH|nr:Sperm motility kinase X [Microtus ochrogaster]
MEIIKNLSSKTRKEETMERDVNASTYEEETITDHYVMLNTLGKGAFAEVKLANHLLTNMKVAVKILANGEESDGHNRKELTIMKELDHPYIIKLFHIINSKDYTYMVLEFAAHGDLVTLIEEGGPLQQTQAQHIFCQIVLKSNQGSLTCGKSKDRPPSSRFIGVGMEVIEDLSSKTIKEETMERDLNASTYEEETITDHYVMLNTLGKGSFAEVKLACHLLTNMKVAVKILANGEESDGHNRKELTIMKELDHPYIIKLFHIINSKDYTYMVLEFAAHGSLVTHIEEGGPLQQTQAQHIFCQIVCAVHYCHDNDIAHRDIKLDNILLDGKGNIKLCDFGMAIRVRSGQRCKGFCGTIEYCAPELFYDTEYDARAVDIWSMAVVLYAMVTASFPFKARTYSDMKENMLNPTYEITYTLSENVLLLHLIVHLFTLNPEQRPTIYDIRQHHWIRDREEFWKLPSSSETLCNKPNPSVVLAMWRLGYHPTDISDCLHEKKFNNIMATYLILNHESAQDHIKSATKPLQACVTVSSTDALESLHPKKRMSEPALPTFTLLAEHQGHDEKCSSKQGSRSLSMPATLCCLLKEDNPPHQEPMCAPEVTPLLSRSLAVGSVVCNEWSSRCQLSECISSAEYLSCEKPQEVSTLKNSSDAQSTLSVRKERETPQGMSTSETHVTQRPSLQTTSKNNLKGVLPEDVSTVSASSLSKGWKRVRKRIGNCVRFLCCCLPLSGKSHVSQKKEAPLEGESSAGAHTQLNGVPKMHFSVY